ncbi:response regulator [Bowmanella denitrificans]|uniref:histidine kinase n=1 Tax=Bowmanella denitrificans TaxID=366582 RepID=A0ABN0XMP7_9ALTE
MTIPAGSDKPKILMVDDRPENLLALERLLRELPVQLFRASSGNEALQLTLHHDFALALLDIQMPEMDGYELAELLRQEEKTARMPFIFISAIYTEHINIFQGYEKGAFSYIVKPFEPSILLNKVKLFIDMYEYEQSLKCRTLELEKANIELEVANKELESFSYSVSHDLRAPLRSIDGFSLALEEEFSDLLDEQGQDYLRRIRRGAQRMSLLIDDLLSLSRVSRVDPKFKPVSITGLATEICQEHQVAQPGRTVVTDIQSDLEVMGDPGLLRIVLDNLLGNAWKFTTGTKNANISVGSKIQEGERVFCVQDNGVGFNMEHASKLFAPFQRLHSVDEFPGTGIGLATVQRIIHKHGGKIWVQAEPGQGASFYFTLPAPSANK